MLRETPLLAARTRESAAVCPPRRDLAPPVPPSVSGPNRVEELVDHAVGRVLDLVDLDTDLPHRWREAEN
jgi:flavin prenyltransferase